MKITTINIFGDETTYDNVSEYTIDKEFLVLTLADKTMICYNKNRIEQFMAEVKE